MCEWVGVGGGASLENLMRKVVRASPAPGGDVCAETREEKSAAGGGGGGGSEWAAGWCVGMGRGGGGEAMLAGRRPSHIQGSGTAGAFIVSIKEGGGDVSAPVGVGDGGSGGGNDRDRGDGGGGLAGAREVVVSGPGEPVRPAVGDGDPRRACRGRRRRRRRRS